jgi:hypothetical protein
MNADVVKGGWAPDEDQRLLSAIDRFGTKFVDFLFITQYSDRHNSGGHL